MVGDGSRSPQPETRTPSKAGEVRRGERRVRGDDGDATAPGVAPASRLVAQQPAHRDAVHPELVPRAEVPTVEPPATRLDVPIPPFQSKQIIPVPAPTAPWSNLSPEAASRARPASAASTWTTRASLSQLSSHSATTGMTIASTPTAGSAATAAATAPSYTRPTDIVAVR
jgi:hypothetical protein